MSLLGMPVTCAHVDTPEELDSPLAADPAALAVHLALEKMAEARAQGLGKNSVMITLDTIVAHEGAVLGKPLDVDHAWQMLRSLSGREHQVVTGVALMIPGDTVPGSFAVVTDVRMKELSDSAITEWMAAGEFMGCAGAYNIEGQVAEVEDAECYQNVTGTPLCHIWAWLAGRIGPDPTASESAVGACGRGLTSPVAACNKLLERRCKLGPRLVEQLPRGS